MGPLIPLFWTSGDFSSGFQSQEWAAFFAFGRGIHVTSSSKFTSGVTPVILFTVSMAAELFSSMYLEWSQRNHQPLESSVSQMVTEQSATVSHWSKNNQPLPSQRTDPLHQLLSQRSQPPQENHQPLFLKNHQPLFMIGHINTVYMNDLALSLDLPLTSPCLWTVTAQAAPVRERLRIWSLILLRVGWDIDGWTLIVRTTIQIAIHTPTTDRSLILNTCSALEGHPPLQIDPFY